MLAILDFVAFIISIALMASTIVISSGLILRTRPLPYAHALLIATVANGLGKVLLAHHSLRNARSGSILDADSAGARLAAKATSSSRPAAAP